MSARLGRSVPPANSLAQAQEMSATYRRLLHRSKIIKAPPCAQRTKQQSNSHYTHLHSPQQNPLTCLQCVYSFLCGSRLFHLNAREYVCKCVCHYAKKTSVLSLPFTSNTSQITYGHLGSVRMASWFALNIGFADLKLWGFKSTCFNCYPVC